MPPKKIAVATETPITSKVYFMVSSLVGQLTFFISSFTSFRKVTILFGMVVMFMTVGLGRRRGLRPLLHLASYGSSVFKKARPGSSFILLGEP